jgi:hypothetical protein
MLVLTFFGRAEVVMIRYVWILMLSISSTLSFAQAPNIGSIGGGGAGLSTLSVGGLVDQTFDLLSIAAEPLGNAPELIIPGLDSTPLAPVGAVLQLGSSAVFNLSSTLGIVEGLAIPAVRGLVPVAGVLLDTPLLSVPVEAVDYLLTEGGVINPALLALPSIPLVNAPLLSILPSL